MMSNQTMARRDIQPFDPSAPGPAASPASRPGAPVPARPDITRGADQYDIVPPKGGRAWPFNGGATAPSAPPDAWQPPDPKSLPPLNAPSAPPRTVARNIHAPEDHAAPLDLDGDIRKAVGGLAALLFIRVAARVVVYLLAVWFVSRYPYVGIGLYALVLSDFLFHFGHAIIFGSMAEGVQAWLGLIFASLMGWLDPNGWFGMAALDPFEGRTMGFAVAILVLIRVSIAATFTKGPLGHIQIWAEEGPDYRPKETLWFRARRWVSFIWRLI